MDDALKPYQDYVPLLLRIAVGSVFIVAGWGKLTGIDGTAEFFGGVGIPLPVFSAWLVAIVEFFGGIMVLLGFFTRIPAILLGIIMIVAMITVKFEAGWGGGGLRVDFMLLLMCISLLFTGDGKASIGEATGKTI